MELEEYRKELLEEIKVQADSNGDSIVDTFIADICDKLVNNEVISDYEISYITYTNKHRKKGYINAYNYDEFSRTLTVILSIFSDEKEMKTLTQTECKKNFDRGEFILENIFNGEILNKYDISTSQYDFINFVSRKKNEIQRISYIIISDLAKSDKIDNLGVKKIDNINYEYSLWTIDRLYNLYASDQLNEELEIDFIDYTENGIPIIQANKNEKCESYLGIISGELLAAIYDKYGSKLLEGNVRSFLSLRGAVNKQIRRSILEEPDMFFAYNNGIAATTTNIEIKKIGESLFLTSVKNFQIVNGGQTTATLSTVRFKDKASLKDIYVQMKLTKVEGEKAEKIIPMISRSSNSQNKVSEVDFFSTSPFHIRLEQISRKLYVPAINGNQFETHWFYERARGQYIQEQLKMTKAQKNDFKKINPKNQLITKSDLAKYVNSWNGKPHIVSKGAQSSFLEFAKEVDPLWKQDNTKFNEKYYKDIISIAILFKTVQKIVSKQEWYQNAYRANIVTYSIAFFNYKIKEQYKDNIFDLSQIYNKQKVPNAVNEIFVEITKIIFTSITSPGKVTMNVTQWCKKSIAWDEIKKIDYVIPASINYFLIESQVEKIERSKYKKEQKILNDIEFQTKVVMLGIEYWKKAFNFGQSKNLLSFEDIKLFKLVTNMNAAKIPNSYQCSKLLEILDRLHGEGFCDNILSN